MEAQRSITNRQKQVRDAVERGNVDLSIYKAEVKP
jgi:predicted Holliday junction resolvase-like endonuclease